jgi:demethylmenaquinone methyltransferase / 2-methoxy-6-polyprenyl-1,4-benzoquinol methylase
MPQAPVPGNPVPPGEVRAMFDRIAPIYDRMNTVMTAGLDAGWRRAAVRAAKLRPGMSAVDVACGSGALTRELARVVGPSGTVLGVDVAPAMLARARQQRPPGDAARPEYREGDALSLPVDDGVADAATMAFGLRNVGDYRRALEELRRVVRTGGRVVVLELATPRTRMGRAVAASWFRRAVPLVGRLAGAGNAYRYLPVSVGGYPEPNRIAELMAEVGLIEVTWRRLGLGMVTLHAGRRA